MACKNHRHIVDCKLPRDMNAAISVEIVCQFLHQQENKTDYLCFPNGFHKETQHKLQQKRTQRGFLNLLLKLYFVLSTLTENDKQKKLWVYFFLLM